MQAWGGGFYLFNKVFFDLTERKKAKGAKEKERYWRTRSWMVYLIGLPAWVIVFVTNRNWMAASVEAGGAPSMILGLINARRGVDDEPSWLDNFARVCAGLGIAYSLYDFGGITTLNQILELGVVIGFLIGTYLLAKARPNGCLLFMLMNGSNAGLMWLQGYPWLMWQQIVSLVIVVDAYRINKTSTRSPAAVETGS